MSTYASESDDIDHHQKSAQEYLHNYGIAYCLSKAERYREEAGIAMGGYFQLGQHGNDTQKLVRAYIDRQLEANLGGYKDKKMKAYLMRCLEISYSTQYRNYIKDVYALDVIEN
ncbi:hypothetical protein G9F32_08805 [Acinetobacter sp. 194]|uniref:hypothetical protein n=1 Tax=Acinetobacter shaoyimingii TaxID=2715164 RepID=UPI001D0E26C4|nr:hypothetical protein [Acinetobacter shaoyimingii]NHB58118.1 hypothetical protein [Acinetobacter shaoyimingii]